VNVIQAAIDDMPDLLQRSGSVWRAAARQGVLIAGESIGDMETPR